MFVSKVIMEILPNIHLLGALTMIYTIVYRKQALIPIYIYVLLNGVYVGFSPFWLPYCYAWTVLWGITMLLPKKMPTAIAVPVYVSICALHGFVFDIFYIPIQMLWFGENFEGVLVYLIGGIPYDIVHAIGNAIAALLVLPLSTVLLKLEKPFTSQK